VWVQIPLGVPKILCDVEWIEVKQVQGLDRYAKLKYSAIPVDERFIEDRSRIGMTWLLKNGYVAMNGFALNEILNMIRALKEMKLEYKMVTIDRNVNNPNDKNMVYEFTLGYFEDDRE
jgi:hypothetical protein